MYKLATGWLGWSPDVALHSPVSLIEAAFDGLIDRLNKTNPYAKPEPEMIPAHDTVAVREMFRRVAASRQ